MLFARNERVACHVQTASGPMVILFVGAINVGTIYTKWTGDIRPRHKGIAEDIDLSRFNLGSTVILLLPPGTSNQFVGISAGDTVSMGQAIGTLQDSRCPGNPGPPGKRRNCVLHCSSARAGTSSKKTYLKSRHPHWCSMPSPIHR